MTLLLRFLQIESAKGLKSYTPWVRSRRGEGRQPSAVSDQHSASRNLKADSRKLIACASRDNWNTNGTLMCLKERPGCAKIEFGGLG